MNCSLFVLYGSIVLYLCLNICSLLPLYCSFFSAQLMRVDAAADASRTAREQAFRDVDNEAESALVDADRELFEDTCSESHQRQLLAAEAQRLHPELSRGRAVINDWLSDLQKRDKWSECVHLDALRARLKHGYPPCAGHLRYAAPSTLCCTRIFIRCM